MGPGTFVPFANKMASRNSNVPHSERLETTGRSPLDLDHLGPSSPSPRRAGPPRPRGASAAKSGVSRGLAAAERAVGAQLVERSSRAMRLGRGRRLHGAPPAAHIRAAVAGRRRSRARPGRAPGDGDGTSAPRCWRTSSRGSWRLPGGGGGRAPHDDVVDLTTGGFDAALLLSARALGRGRAPARRVIAAAPPARHARVPSAARITRAPDELSDTTASSTATRSCWPRRAGERVRAVRAAPRGYERHVLREVARAGTASRSPSFSRRTTCATAASPACSELHARRGSSGSSGPEATTPRSGCAPSATSSSRRSAGAKLRAP